MLTLDVSALVALQRSVTCSRDRLALRRKFADPFSWAFYKVSRHVVRIAASALATELSFGQRDSCGLLVVSQRGTVATVRPGDALVALNSRTHTRAGSRETHTSDISSLHNDERRPFARCRRVSWNCVIPTTGFSKGRVVELKGCAELALDTSSSALTPHLAGPPLDAPSHTRLFLKQTARRDHRAATARVARPGLCLVAGTASYQTEFPTEFPL